MKNKVIQVFKTLYNDYMNRVLVRMILLTGAIGFGVFLVNCYFDSISKFLILPDSTQDNSRITSFVYSSILALPLLSVLWLFRTKDVREQISKTEQQINTTQFNKAVDLALATTTNHIASTITKNNGTVIDSVKRGAGVTMLAQLYQRCDDDLRKSIDNITIGLELFHIKIPNINLAGMNFNFARLEGANLNGSNLQGAYLKGTFLQEAELQDADLQNADLRCAHLEGVTWHGAKYNHKTKFTDGFDPIKKGMKLVE